MSEKNSMVHVDPTQFGLEETKAAQIEAMFTPMLQKMTALEGEYNEILALPLTEETCKKAKELRLKFVRIRTATAGLHKELKAFYLAGGRFVDGWKSAQAFASAGIEYRLESIEKHYENMASEELKKQTESRMAELAKYGADFVGGSAVMIGQMPDDVWDNYLTGVRTTYENRKEAERKAEEQRAAEAKKRKDEEEARLAEQERIRLEAVEQAKKEKAEREAAEALLAKERKERAESERIQREELERIQKADKDRQDAEKAERIRIEAERVRAEEAEEQRKAAAEAAPDNEKLMAYSKALEAVPVPELSTQSAKTVMIYASGMLRKTILFIQERAK